MDTPKKKHWFKRIFSVDYGLEAVSPPLEIAPILEAKNHTVFAQVDRTLVKNGNSSITVSLDNVNKSAFLRFGSSEAVDTVDAVWFISKTGNKVKNTFGDELSPNAPRTVVRDFLLLTQEKQGDTPIDISVPPHDHDFYQEQIDAEIKAREEGDEETLEEAKKYTDEAIEGTDFPGGQATAQVGKRPPERPVEGDLWFMSDVFLAEGEIPIELSNDKLFVYADNKWEPATSLQHERRMRELGDEQTWRDAEYYTQREDGKHITRLDKALLPEPVFVDKAVTVHEDGVIPPFDDDNLHHSDPISKKYSTIAYKGEDPGPGIYYAIISHKSTPSYPSPRREEWIVKSVTYENGIVTIEAHEPYGCVGGSSRVYTATLWLLTQEDATKLPFHSHDDQYAQKGHEHAGMDTEAIDELNARMDEFEELMKPWTGIDIGTYRTKRANYEPTGNSQAEGMAETWWTDTYMNTTPMNHVRIGMQADKDMCTKIAAYPVPFELDIIQPEATQTMHIYDVYERGEGVLHLLCDVAWGDALKHDVYSAVDSQYIVRKV